MVKEENVLNLCNFFRSSRGLNRKISTKSKIVTLLIIILGISMINSVRAYLNYQDIITPLFQSLFGMPILFLIVYSIYYIFQSAFESKSNITFWKSYLQIGIPLLFGFFIIHFINLLQFLSNNISINYFFALINSILFIYLFIMFVLNTKNYFSTTYPKVFASLLLVFLVNFALIAIMTVFGMR